MAVVGPPLGPKVLGRRPPRPTGNPDGVSGVVQGSLGVRIGEGKGIVPVPHPLAHKDAAPMGLDPKKILRTVKEESGRPGNPKASIEEAKAFLDSLEEGVRNGADKGAALGRLQEVTSSDWFKKISEKNVSLTSRVSEIQRNLATGSPAPSKEPFGSDAPSVARTPIEGTGVFGSLEKRTVDLLVEFLANHRDETVFPIDDQWYRAQCENGGQEIHFFECQGTEWKKVAIQDLLTGEFRLESGVEGDSSVMETRLEKYKEKLSKMFVLYGSLLEAMKGSQIKGAKAEKIAGKIAAHWASQWRYYVEGEGVPVPDAPAGTLVWHQPPKGSQNRILGLKVNGPGMDAWYSPRVIGQGGFSKVKKLIRIKPNGEIEVSWVRIASRKDVDKEESKKEKEVRIDFQRKLDAEEDRLPENIKGYKRFIAGIRSFPSHIGESEVFKKWVIQEEASGDLFDYIEGPEDSPVSESERKARQPQALSVLYDTVRGLRYLHEAGFVHKDIKPENILMFPGGSAKITDFGCVARYRPEKITDSKTGDQQENKAEVSGSPGYVAPELFENNPSLVEDPSMDMFSFGVMLLQMVDVDDSVSYLRELERDVVNEKKELLDLTEELKALQRLFREKGTEPWILISDLIDIDPRKRPTSAETEARLATLLHDPSMKNPLA